MNTLFLQAIKDASKIRNNLGLDMFEPLNIYDICEKLNVTVRIVNINMEGLYIKADRNHNATILISNERPLTRRVFTCAHEFGHHFYGHGSKVDALKEDNPYYTSEQNKEELLVNAFAGSLLMPVAGIQTEFIKRNLKPENSTPLNFYTISSFFGVGYQTLVYHCRANKIINNSQMKSLLKHTPAKILKNNFSRNIEISHFKYIDNYSQPSLIDLEISNYLIIPTDVHIDNEYFKKVTTTDLGTTYVAIKKGITELVSVNFENNINIRIESKNYVGLSIYKYIE